MKKCLLFVVSIACLLVSCKPDPEKPTVVTFPVTEITETTAKTGGNVTADGGAEVTSRGVCWSVEQNPTVENDKTSDGSGVGEYYSNINDLMENTTYYVRAYAINSEGVSYGEEFSFTTLEIEDEDLELPSVVTSAVAEITTTTAKAGGEVTADGGTEVTARGVCWSVEQNPTIENDKTIDGSGVGTYQSELTNLSQNTTYYVRAYATNSEGTSYGDEVSFTTMEEIIITTPTVVTLDATEITETTAAVASEVTADGGAEVTARGVCWSINQNPTIENDKTVEGDGLGSFQSNLTGLSQNTTYYVRAYATNSEGTAYGEEISFTTMKEIVIELPTVVTMGVTEISETSANCGGEITYDGGAEVTARGVCWSIESEPTIEDNKTLDGSGMGYYQSVLSELTPGTTYYVRAYATNSAGTAYGTEVSFETNAEEEGFINGYEYVDLGLPSGLKWATHNIGAELPIQAGDYFAWGEINAKTYFTEANCTSYGLNMQDIGGNPQYDAARANWGGTWKVPGKNDFEELIEACTWEWTVINGIGCKKVTGPNGNYIILPITGYMYESSLYMQDFGYYWTSTPIETYENFSYDFLFDMEYNLTMGFDDRCYGQTIRPVSD